MVKNSYFVNYFLYLVIDFKNCVNCQTKTRHPYYLLLCILYIIYSYSYPSLASSCTRPLRPRCPRRPRHTCKEKKKILDLMPKHPKVKATSFVNISG